MFLGLIFTPEAGALIPQMCEVFCNKVSKSLTQGSPTCRSTCVLQSQLSWRPLAFPAMLCSSNTVLCFIHAFSYGRRSFCPGPTECRSQSLASAFAVMSCRDAVCSDPCVTVVLQDANLGQFRMRLKRLTAPSSEETNSAHGRPGRLGVGLQQGRPARVCNGFGRSLGFWEQKTKLETGAT